MGLRQRQQPQATEVELVPRQSRGMEAGGGGQERYGQVGMKKGGRVKVATARNELWIQRD